MGFQPSTVPLCQLIFSETTEKTTTEGVGGVILCVWKIYRYFIMYIYIAYVLVSDGLMESTFDRI